MFLAITGAIGSGKTYVSNIFKEYGFEVVDSDKLVLKSYEDEDVKRQLQEVFGCVVADKVDKKILKEKLNKNNIQTLNNIIHPFVEKEIIKLKESNQNILVEVPLLFEVCFDSLFDYTICVVTNRFKRQSNLKKRDKNNYKFIKMLEKAQFSQKEKAKQADFIIKNKKGDLKLKEQISAIIDLVLK